MTRRRAPGAPLLIALHRSLRSAFAFAAVATWLVHSAGQAQESTGTATGLALIPSPVGYVNDQGGVLDEATRGRLEAYLDQLQRKTGAQFAVLTVRSTAPETPDAYKVRVFEAWSLGERGKDNGLLMLVALAEREVRFETGYGLEGTLPDGFLGRVFREEMQERFRADDYPGGIVAGVVRVAQRIAAEQGDTLQWDNRALRYTGESRKGIPPWLVILLILIVLIAISRAGGDSSFRGRRRRRRGYGGFGGWGGGGLGGGGWGGGFGGGGFGGGGGGSFGGFGGGRSGGGGGGGSW